MAADAEGDAIQAKQQRLSAEMAIAIDTRNAAKQRLNALTFATTTTASADQQLDAAYCTMHAAEPGQHASAMLAAATCYETLLSGAVHGDQAIPEREVLLAEKVAEARLAFILAAESSSVKPMRRQRQHRRRR